MEQPGVGPPPQPEKRPAWKKWQKRLVPWLVLGLLVLIVVIIIWLWLAGFAGQSTTTTASSVTSSNSGSPTTGRPATTEPQQCGQPDIPLANALVMEIPSITGITPTSAAGTCPTGSRSVGFRVSDGAGSGILEAILIPGSNGIDSRTSPFLYAPQGTKTVTVLTRSGGELTLISRPNAGSSVSVFDAVLSDTAARLASRF